MYVRELLVARASAHLMRLAALMLATTVPTNCMAGQPSGPEIVRTTLSAPAKAIDFGRAKLALDSVIDPRIDADAVNAQIEAIVKTIEEMPGGQGSYRERLGALRTYIYESGPWNGDRPYRYDPQDPFGEDLNNKLLANYLSRRFGNCVTMPSLFVVLAQRLEIDATLSTAPSHMFVKVRDPATGRVFNVEATSGAHVARDEWYRQKMPMHDDAIANGVYMKTLTKKESVAVMAEVLLEHYLRRNEAESVIEVANAILEAYPANVNALLAKGSAYSLLIDRQFRAIYPTPGDIPRALRPAHDRLAELNESAFERAEHLGWREKR